MSQDHPPALNEGDEGGSGHAYSVGRMLSLSDGVFAIAMTLLALDLHVPDLSAHATDGQLRHALAMHKDNYFSYLISFYVVATYWMQHHRILRSTVASHPKLLWANMRVLLLVAALPFPATLLGEDGSQPTALAIYGAMNVGASLALLRLHYVATKYELVDARLDIPTDRFEKFRTWAKTAIFVLCIPAGFVLGSYGPFVLLLLWPIEHGYTAVQSLLRRGATDAA